MELTAFGTALRGLAVSAATRPHVSEPDRAKTQVGMTARKPLKPLVKPPVSCQYLKPMGSPLGAPPAEMTIMVMMTTKIQPNLTAAKTTSVSAK